MSARIDMALQSQYSDAKQKVNMSFINKVLGKF